MKKSRKKKLLVLVVVGHSLALSLVAVAAPNDLKDQCKNQGWRDLTDSNGQSFKNQGQCISYANHGGTFGNPGPTIIFSDNFNGENGGAASLNYSGFAQWTVTDGTVDIIGNGIHDFYPGNGLYVDLDGTTSDAGVMSTAPLSLPSDTYQLQFDLGGSQRFDDNVVTVSLGTIWTETFSVPSGQPLTTITRVIATSTATTGALSVSNAGGDDIGAILDNVELTRI